MSNPLWFAAVKLTGTCINSKSSLLDSTISPGNPGQAVVEKLIGEGYQAIGTVTKEDQKAITKYYETVVVNLMEEQASADFTKEVIGKYRHIDVAVLTVSGFAMGTVESISSADIIKQYKLNFETAYNIARPVFSQMIQQYQIEKYF